MNVEDFVREALQQLGAGIASVQGRPGITVSPRPYMRDDPSNTAGDHLVDSSGQVIIEFVEFDLSVVVSLTTRWRGSRKARSSEPRSRRR
jgi:hypothetical protein